MIARRGLLGAGVAAALAGCGGASPGLRPLAPDAVVLAHGDSLTFGTGAPAAMSYPAQLARLIGREVVNAGVPGEVSADGLKRLPRLLDAHQPALVVLCHGGNDILRRMNRQGTVANVSAMLAVVRGHGADAVLVAVPEFGLFLAAADFYAQIGEEAGVPVETEALSEILGDNELKADQVHPNAAGYGRLAEAVAGVLRGAGAV